MTRWRRWTSWSRWEMVETNRATGEKVRCRHWTEKGARRCVAYNTRLYRPGSASATGFEPFAFEVRRLYP